MTRRIVTVIFTASVFSTVVLARTWTDRSGEFEVEAEYVGYKNGKVRLKSEKGKSITVDVQRLSQADQEFVAEKRRIADEEGNPFNRSGLNKSVKALETEKAMEGLGCREPEHRARLLAKFGGTMESEAAVALALNWLAKHQREDGSWRFDHREGECKGRCMNHGNLDGAPNASTAMSLLPFLAAGQTHSRGEFKSTVRAGLEFLVQNMKEEEDGGSFYEPRGTMYSHGLATIALCEACAMTGDMNLMKPAQLALDYTEFAQDPDGGGWRYQPRQTGDTSVFGWQFVALQTGRIAGLEIANETLAGAERFLDMVQSNAGARYGYTTPASGPATTAIGLLSRIHLGWKHENVALKSGIEFLSETGVSKKNMYFNYFATQALFHYQGEWWKTWNEEMRDYLVDEQSKDGHQAGSWFVGADHGSRRGGRLYCTSLATLILESYYRHPLLYP